MNRLQARTRHARIQVPDNGIAFGIENLKPKAGEQLRRVGFSRNNDKNPNTS